MLRMLSPTMITSGEKSIAPVLGSSRRTGRRNVGEADNQTQNPEE